MIRVLIADDYPVVREGLREIISKATDMTVAGDAANGQEVLDLVEHEKFDVIVLDLNLPGKHGFEVLRELNHMRPKPHVLVLSMHPEDQIGLRAFRAGASGFMNKEVAPRELLDAIRKVSAGGKYMSQSLAERLASVLIEGTNPKPHETLSGREYQVFFKIASGRSVNQIAAELTISAKTVRTYRERILEKLQMKNDVELTHYAIQHKILP